MNVTTHKFKKSFEENYDNYEFICMESYGNDNSCSKSKVIEKEKHKQPVKLGTQNILYNLNLILE